MSNFSAVKSYKRWTPEEDRDVMRMSYSAFQLIHGRTKQAIQSRREYINNGHRTKAVKWGDIVKPDERPSKGALAERERRRALVPRDTTAAILGDPLPGLSALDRRTMEERRFDNPCAPGAALHQQPIRQRQARPVQEPEIQRLAG